MCPGCNESLNESVIIDDGDGSPALKSCPNCSEREGRHVFYRHDAFGYRQMGEHRRVQSWCGPCRSKQLATNPAHTC